MAFLPRESLTLTGGCFCKAVQYKIQIPESGRRPLIPGAVKARISPTEEVENRLPIIQLDHCQRCRDISGTIIQCWLICPAGWVEWDLLTLRGDRIALSTMEAVGPEQEGTQSIKTHLTRFNATDRATRTFCNQCGTNLSYVSYKRLGPAAIVDVTVGSLDDESLIMARPDHHGWWDSGIDWINELTTNGDGGFLNKHAAGDLSQRKE